MLELWKEEQDLGWIMRVVKQGTTDTSCGVVREILTAYLEKRHPTSVGKYRERLPREAVLSPSLELCKTWPSQTLICSITATVLDYMTSRGLCQPSFLLFCDCQVLWNLFLWN